MPTATAMYVSAALDIKKKHTTGVAMIDAGKAAKEDRLSPSIFKRCCWQSNAGDRVKFVRSHS